MRLFLFVLVFTPIALFTACGGSSDVEPDPSPFPEGAVYLALGDSIAAGAGASASPENETSYVALVHRALERTSDEAIVLQSVAQGGATTEDLISRQLPGALGALQGDDVRLVTLTIGGNDLNILQDSAGAATCIADVNDPSCPVAEILLGTEERLDRTLGELRTAAPDVRIAIQLYPNLFSGTAHPFERPAGQAFGKLNDVIERVAMRHDVLVANPRAAFEGRAGDLAHTLDPTPDFHPNDAGYEAIAAAFLEVLGLE